jgi:transcriptional regulator with XRE-family HTH domain
MRRGSMWSAAPLDPVPDGLKLIGDAIHRYRRENKISMRTLATSMGTDLVQFNKIEGGRQANLTARELGEMCLNAGLEIIVREMQP